MQRTQIYLTEAQGQGLRTLARRTGRKQSELIRDAVDRLLAEPPAADWKEALRRTAGMWADRPSIEEEMREIRASMDRTDALWQDR